MNRRIGVTVSALLCVLAAAVLLFWQTPGTDAAFLGRIEAQTEGIATPYLSCRVSDVRTVTTEPEETGIVTEVTVCAEGNLPQGCLLVELGGLRYCSAQIRSFPAEVRFRIRADRQITAEELFVRMVSAEEQSGAAQADGAFLITALGQTANADALLPLELGGGF